MFSKLRKMILPMGILALGLLIAGCGGDSKKAEVPDLKELRITYVKAPLNIPSIVEKKQQSFEKAFPGVKLTFPEIASGAKQTEAMAAGELDIANALGGTSAILAAANGADVKILGIYSRAPKAFTIMVKDPSIQSVKDLKGKKIGGPKGTILHQVLLSALAAEGMSAEDVEFVNMDIPPAVAALQSGSLDAALVAGPGVYQATQNGARILKTGEGLGVEEAVVGGEPGVVPRPVVLGLRDGHVRVLSSELVPCGVEHRTARVDPCGALVGSLGAQPGGRGRGLGGGLAFRQG